MVRGRSLLGPHQRLLVRSGGRFPLVEVLATSGPSAAAASTADTAHQEPAAAVARTKDATFGGGLQGPQEEWLEMRYRLCYGAVQHAAGLRYSMHLTAQLYGTRQHTHRALLLGLILPYSPSRLGSLPPPPTQLLSGLCGCACP